MSNVNESGTSKQENVKQSLKDCGLVRMDLVNAQTKDQLDRIFSGSQFEGYEQALISLSQNQTDHVALELAFFRLQRVMPKVSLILSEGIVGEIDGILLVNLPTKDDPNKKIGTVILVNADLVASEFDKYIEELSKVANGVRMQLEI